MAEPFGLFQILQSFLAQNPETPTAQPQPATERADEKTAEPPVLDAATAEEPESAERGRAVLDFMQAHEIRAKRIKKP